MRSAMRAVRASSSSRVGGGSAVKRPRASCTPSRKAIFVVCPCCDRGQVYCSVEHRGLGRRACRRRSNAVHQASEWGRQDHAQRNREYRARRRHLAARVTGHPADNLPSAAIVAPAESAPVVMSTSSAPLSSGAEIDEHAGEVVRGADADAVLITEGQTDIGKAVLPPSARDHPPSPRLAERDARDRVHHVDAERWASDRRHALARRELAGPPRELGEPEVLQRGREPGCIGLRRLDQHVEIIRRARAAVCRERVRADDQVRTRREINDAQSSLQSGGSFAVDPERRAPERLDGGDALRDRAGPPVPRLVTLRLFRSGPRPDLFSRATPHVPTPSE